MSSTFGEMCDLKSMGSHVLLKLANIFYKNPLLIYLTFKVCKRIHHILSTLCVKSSEMEPIFCVCEIHIILCNS